MNRKRFLRDDISASPEALWHAYVIRCYYNIPYNINVMLDKRFIKILKRYLDAVIFNEYDKIPVLTLLRECKKDFIYRTAKKQFPSIFVKKRPKYQMRQPSTDELLDSAFDLAAIQQLGLDKIDIEEERRKIAMENIEINGDELDGVMIDIVRQVPTGETTASGRPRLKEEVMKVDAGKLTVNNFLDVTGRRFRMTAKQRERYGDNREAAFQDWLREQTQGVDNG